MLKIPLAFFEKKYLILFLPYLGASYTLGFQSKVFQDYAFRGNFCHDFGFTDTFLKGV